MAPRERSNEELAEDIQWIMKEMQRLRNRQDRAPYVRTDLHEVQLASIKADLEGLHHQLTWILTILGSLFVALIVALIGFLARSGFG